MSRETRKPEYIKSNSYIEDSDKIESYFYNVTYNPTVNVVNEPVDPGPPEPLELPLLPENEEYKLILQNGEVFAVNVADYPTFRMDNSLLISNAIMYDIGNSQRFKFDNTGSVCVEHVDVEENEHEQYQYTSNFDFYGKYKVINSEKKVISKSSLSFNDIASILYTPVLYFNNIKKESNQINKLLSCFLQESGQFDERFIIKPKSPDSPLLDKYLTTLAELINSEIDEKEEIENIEDLEKKAYEKVGYNKPIESVINEAKDFEEYFRFLLVKKDKQVIDEKDYNYVNQLSSLIKNRYSFKSGKAKVNKEFSFEDEKYSKQFSFSEVVDRIEESDSNLMITLFLYVPNILRLTNYLEDNKTDIKIGMIYEILNNNYNKKSKTIKCTLFVCDSNYNCKFIDIKSTTLLKYKNRFIEVISNFDKSHNDSRLANIPRELRALNSI